jgi:voltage-gated potassium channel
MATSERAALAERWERITEWPLIVAALIFLAVYAIPIVDPTLPRTVGIVCYWLGWMTWLVFVMDYLIRLFLAEDRRHYLVRHWIDLLIVALPLLRPLRLLRLVPLISVLNRRASSLLRGRVAIYVAVGSSLVGFVAALAVLSAERGRPNSNIENIGDAVWWAAETMTTVGYGDKYPVTALGRTIAVGLMVCGIALLGTVTATLASWLVEHVSQTEVSETARLMERIDRLEAKLDAVLRPDPPGPGGSGVP